MATLITKGEDRTIELAFLENSAPFNLTNWTTIAVQFKKSDNQILEKDTLAADIAAEAIYDSVKYTADVAGIGGNTISLVFDGNDSIATVITAWNTANPANTVSSNGADDTVIPAAKTLTLLGGKDAYAYVTLLGDPLLGKIAIDLTETDSAALKTGKGLSVKAVVDFGVNPGGQRRIFIFDNAINVVDGSF